MLRDLLWVDASEIDGISSPFKKKKSKAKEHENNTMNRQDCRK